MGKIINKIRERRNKPIEVESPELYTTDTKGKKLSEEGTAEVIKDTQAGASSEQTAPQAEIIHEQPAEKITQTNATDKTEPFAKITDEEVASLAKNMEGGLTYENIQRAYDLVKTGGNIDTSLPEPKAELPKAKTLEETITSPVVTPEIKVPAPQAEEAESKTYPEDWLMTYKKANPKPNVLNDLGLAGYENYNVPDDLLNYFGKNLKTAIDQITDKDGKPLTEEQKKKILRRIRGVRVGDALMKIANITGQAVGVGMGGRPVAMDNVPILQRIGANAQAKQDAWIKQALKAKEQDDKNKYNEAKLNMDLWDRETKAQYNAEKLALDKLKAQNKINETQYNMLLNAKKLEAAIANNNRKNAIAQQRADAYEKDRAASNAIMKNNRHYYLNGVPYVVPSSQLNKMAGSLISELADEKNKNIVDGSPMLQEYLKKENIEAIKKDANKAEQFLGYITTTHPEIALPIISQNRVSNDIERAYMAGFSQSPISSTPIESESEKEITEDDLLEEY
ncbi:MAG: hypothetical protein IJ341_00240 [Bacteroidales bacterium]|nr:hypothetical protein [Bacteroidales bacterium]